MVDVKHRLDQGNGISLAVHSCKLVSLGEGVAHRLDLGKVF